MVWLKRFRLDDKAKKFTADRSSQRQGLLIRVTSGSDTIMSDT